jgi:Protein kinase domain
MTKIPTSPTEAPAPPAFRHDFGGALLARLAICIDEHAAAEALPTGEVLSCLKLLSQATDNSQADARTLLPRPDELSQCDDGPLGPAPILPMRLGRFELRSVLGIGGFGIVFRAFDTELDREVALKIPRPDIAVLPNLRERFVREAQAAATLDNPGIVPVFETGRIGLVWYISTALCSGPTLAAWLIARSEPVPTRSAAALVRQLAQAVQHAHDRGVLHRDLKPSNVLLEPVGPGADELEDYVPRIADFGLAKRLNSATQHTKNGALLGTLPYMAPEQVAARSEQTSVQTDVYALGAILYELLAGAPPLVGDNDAQTMSLILETDPRPPQRPGGRIHRDLACVCLTCLRKDSAERYPSARALGDDLDRYLRGEPVSARPIGRVRCLVRWCRRRPLVASLTGLLIGAVTFGVLGIASQWKRAEDNLVEARRQADIANENLAEAKRQERRATDQLEEAQLLLVHMGWALDDVARYRDAFSDGRSRDMHLKLSDVYHQVLRKHAAETTSLSLPAMAATLEARVASHDQGDAAATSEFQKSLGLWSDIVRQSPEDILQIRAAAMTCYYYGLHRMTYDKNLDSRTRFVGGKLFDYFPLNAAWGRAVIVDYAQLLMAQAGISSATNKREDSLKTLAAAKHLLSNLCEADPAHADYPMLRDEVVQKVEAMRAAQ